MEDVTREDNNITSSRSDVPGLCIEEINTNQEANNKLEKNGNDQEQIKNTSTTISENKPKEYAA